MSTPKVVYLPEAIADLHQIWSFIAQQSQNPEVADRMVDAMDDAAHLYAANPLIGSLRPDLAANLRCFVVGQYVAFYLPRPDGIEIVQIIHGARDIPIHFRTPVK